MLRLEPNICIKGNFNSYYVEEFLDEGAFGQVVKCRKGKTEERVAVKVQWDTKDEYGEREVKYLCNLKGLDADKNNIIKLIEHFEYKGHLCMVFEMLDVSLFRLRYNIMKKPLRVAEIRPIACQMLIALKALKSIGLCHNDISLSNIMLVRHKSQPFRVKLIDFGCASESPHEESFSNDMLCLGQVLAGLFGDRVVQSRSHQKSGNPTEKMDIEEFNRLLMLMLDNPKNVNTPDTALSHPFITMTHLSGTVSDSAYLARARQQMEMAGVEPLVASTDELRLTVACCSDHHTVEKKSQNPQSTRQENAAKVNKGGANLKPRGNPNAKPPWNSYF